MSTSKGVLPPSLPPVSAAERLHERYPVYAKYREACKRNLVDCDSFSLWLWERSDMFVQHPQYFEFRSWMIKEQGGARKCPAGSFPENFLYWLKGGRW
jgi:hypothetical protein